MTPSRTLRACFRKPLRLLDRRFLVTRIDRIGVSQRALVLSLVFVLQPAAIASAQQLAACCQPYNETIPPPRCEDKTPSGCAELSAMQDRPTYSIGGNCTTPQACCIAAYCTGTDGTNTACDGDPCTTDDDCIGGTCEPPQCRDDLTPCECLKACGDSTSGTCAEQCCGKSSGAFPPIPSPFSNLTDLCNAFSGFPTPPHVIPPPNPFPPPNIPPFESPPPFSVPRDNEAYIENLAEFIRDRQYVSLGWLHDLRWRLTGSLGGEPGTSDFLNEGTHLPCRIYYSPGIIRGLCRASCSDSPSTECATDADCPSNACIANACSIVPTCVSTRCVPGGQSCTSDADCPNTCASDADCPPDNCVRHGQCIDMNGVPGITCEMQSQCPDGSLCVTFRPGSMLVKEMHPPSSYVVDPNDGRLWLKDECYSDQPSAWAVMVRGNDAAGIGSDGSHDGWFWLLLDGVRSGNPPILSSSAVTATDFFDSLQDLIDHDPTNTEPLHFPTGEATFNRDGTLKKEGSIVPPAYHFGAETCLDCHASAISDSTFADMNNILGKGTRFPEISPLSPRCPSTGTHALLGGPDLAKHQYPTPLNKDDQLFQDFVDLFPQFGATGVDPAEAFGTLQSPGLRFPAATYDHIVTSPVLPIGGGQMSGAQNQEMFLTSDQCSSCHDATTLRSLNEALPNMALCEEVDIHQPDGSQVSTNMQINLSPYAEWSASPMGMAGRDPIFFSQLETEVSLFQQSKDCIETLCLHCHGVMGQRQLAIDNPAPPGDEICGELLNPDLFPFGVPSFETTAHFTRDYMDEWPGKDGTVTERAKYGGLGRDGISCKVCHSVSNNGLDGGPKNTPTSSPSASPSIFTGNFNVNVPAAVYGPFRDVKNRPMGRALGVGPNFGDGQIAKSALCGSCHAINLPVLTENMDHTMVSVALICSDSTVTGDPEKTMDEVQACEGKTLGDDCNRPDTDDGTCIRYFGYEQATYLEWLDSDFNQPDAQGGQSCQKCHMANTFHQDDGREGLRFKVANIEDETSPDNPRRLPDKDITLTPRGARCVGGANAGDACASDSECPGGACSATCVGGTNEGSACGSSLDCLGGGVCAPTCTNGDAPRAACISDADCAPDGQCELYSRHTLYGLNVFFNEIAQQFPLILGIRQIDHENSGARPALFTAREAVLTQAREQTANVNILSTGDDAPKLANGILTAQVRVDNLTGHKMPSGVGFRRAFVEFLVYEVGNPVPIWASGSTNNLGVIQDRWHEDPLARPLKSEFLCEQSGPYPAGDPCNETAGVCYAKANNQCYQPHYGGINHRVISFEDQVQIFEELQQNNNPDKGPQFTTSFLERFFEIKDNRLLPQGWSIFGIYAVETSPGPGASTDDNFLSGASGFGTGGATVKYEIPLDLDPLQPPPDLFVQATLYYQAIPPYYLNQRFNVELDPKPDTERLHYITSRLNTTVLDDSKEEFIKDWKLRIDKASTAPVVRVPTGACCFGPVCRVETQADCDDLQGIYQGDDIGCNPNPCPQPAGNACCTSDNACFAVANANECFTNGGIAFHPDQSCNGERCGACCNPDIPDVTCVDGEVRGSCVRIDGRFKPGKYCGNEPDPCLDDAPAISEWGMASLILLILVGLTIKFAMARRRA